MGLFDTITSAIAPLQSGLGQIVGSAGNITTQASQGFTPQNKFNATSPLDVNALGAQLAQSQGNLGGINGQQQQLAQALLAQSQGQGPNPAQQMLNQQTNQNIQQNAGLIASQKGINPAYAARLAGQNQAGMSQQAAGQGALMGAQQQVAAQQGLGNVYGQMANQNLQNAATSGQLANQSSLGAQQINAGTSAQNAAAVQNTSGGLLNGIGSSLAKMGGFAHGGMIPAYASGGAVSASSQIANGILAAGGVPIWQSGNQQQGAVKKQPGASGSQNQNAQGLSSSSSSGPTAMAGGVDSADLTGATVLTASTGGKIPAHLHPIAQIYHPDFANRKTTELKARGGDVPGKAKVAGDSKQNDTVPTMLSPGEEVLPRSVMMSKDPAQAAYDFVAKALKERGQYGSGNDHGDFKMALKQAIGSRKGK